MIQYSDFEKVEMRVGRIISVEEFPEARNPSYKILVDLGPELGTKRSAAQITKYERQSLIGRQVVCVVNFPPKQIANTVSEVLILGAPTADRGTSLLAPDHDAIPGSRIF